MTHKNFNFFLLSFFSIIAISCNEDEQVVNICAPDFLDERYRFCINDPLDSIKIQGAVFLEQGQYRITENKLYVINLIGNEPFVYAEFEIRSNKIAVASFRTLPMDYELAKEKWESYLYRNTEFYNNSYKKIDIPERLSERLINDVIWDFSSGGFVRMQLHLMKEGRYLISLELSDSH
jgi:hypothetical protein